MSSTMYRIFAQEQDRITPLVFVDYVLDLTVCYVSTNMFVFENIITEGGTEKHTHYALN